MKKAVIFQAIFFIFLSLMFADENINPAETAVFGWQLLHHKMENKNIDFINLNPVFFQNNNYLLMNLFEDNRNISNSENNRSFDTGIRERTRLFNFLLIFADVISPFVYDLNQQQREIYENSLYRK